jgi:hypothetical protein
MVTDPQHTGSGDTNASEPRILRTVELPLSTAVPSLSGQPSIRSFSGAGLNGQVNSAGEWTIRAKIGHTRLRCGIYEVGMQLGHGDSQCIDVRWITGIEFVTRERQCNSSTRIHAGGGQFSSTVGRVVGAANCVRAVVRCQGTC